MFRDRFCAFLAAKRISRGGREERVERSVNCDRGAHATEIGLRNRAGYCIFDRVPPVRNRSGFPIGLNY